MSFRAATSQANSSPTCGPVASAKLVVRKLFGAIDVLLLRNRNTAIIVALLIGILSRVLLNDAPVKTLNEGARSLHGGFRDFHEDVAPMTRDAVLAHVRSAPMTPESPTTETTRKGKRAVVLRRNIPGITKNASDSADQEDAADILQQFLSQMANSSQADSPEQGENVARAWHTLSNMYIARNRSREALTARLASADRWTKIGISYLQSGKDDDAIASLEEAVKLERSAIDIEEGSDIDLKKDGIPRIAFALTNLGAARLRRAELDASLWHEALSALKEAVKLATTSSGADATRIEKMKASYTNAKSLAVRKGIMTADDPILSE